MAYTQEQLREIFLTLPEDLQDAITSVDTAKTIKKIGDKYSLHVDQIGELADEIGLVMIGVNSYRQFVEVIKEKLRITGDQANGIASDVNTQIFSKIRDLLKASQLERILADAPVLPTTETPIADPAKAIKASLFDQKMGNLYNVPKEDVEIKKPVTESARPFDPYHEPI